MSLAADATSDIDGQLVNAPSWGRFVWTIARGVLFAPIAALVATFIIRRLSFELDWYVSVLVFFVVGWTVVVTVSSPSEPVLLITPTTISVKRWGAQILNVGSWRSYPMQPLTVRTRRGGRGGVWVQIDLVDSTGWQHRVAFNMIGLDDLRNALLAAGCTVY